MPCQLTNLIKAKAIELVSFPLQGQSYKKARQSTGSLVDKVAKDAKGDVFDVAERLLVHSKARERQKRRSL
ncbi:hypothetical protein Tco_1099514 [Tanacetum coccineum]